MFIFPGSVVKPRSFNRNDLFAAIIPSCF